RSPPIVIWYPIESRPTERWKPPRLLAELQQGEPLCFICQPQTSRKDALLFASYLSSEFQQIRVQPIGIRSDLQIRLSDTVYTPGKYGIELRRFRIVEPGP